MILGSRRLWLGAAAVAVLLGLGWAGRMPLLIGYAMLMSEHRPELMEAASQNPPTAAAFNARFRPGTAEAELLAWLDENGFMSIEREGGR